MALPPLRLQRPAVQPAVGAEVPASTGPIPQLLVHHLIEHPRFRGGRLFDSARDALVTRYDTGAS